MRSLIDLVLPRTCVGCARPGVALCSGCRPGEPTEVAPLLGRPVIAGGAYADGLRAALIAYKERGRAELAPALAGILAGAMSRAGPAGAVIVAMPSSTAACRRRGGDPVARLAAQAARRCGRPYVAALSLHSAVHDQAGLDAAQRAVNLAGALHARPPRTGADALLVDDIVTTGASLREALRALTEAGWTVSGAAVVAATPRR